MNDNTNDIPSYVILGINVLMLLISLLKQMFNNKNHNNMLKLLEDITKIASPERLDTEKIPINIPDNLKVSTSKLQVNNL